MSPSLCPYYSRTSSGESLSLCPYYSRNPSGVANESLSLCSYYSKNSSGVANESLCPYYSRTSSGVANESLRVCVLIIEYGSTLYVGMTQKKNGGPIKCVQNLMSELCSGCSQKLL